MIHNSIYLRRKQKIYLQGSISVLPFDTIAMIKALFVIGCLCFFLPPQMQNGTPLGTTSITEKLSNDTLTQRSTTRDTIIERTNPTALDMSREQLFIDTSRTSSYYQQLAHWLKKPFLYDSWMLEQAASKKAQGCTAHTTGLKFPRTWLTLHWYNGKFLLYEPCDGIDADARYHFTDSLLFVLRGVDSEALPICSYRRTKHKEVVAMFDGGTEVYITPTTTPNVYLMTADGLISISAFVCPVEKYKHFELLVHHCPERKVAPPQIFDKMP